MGAPTPRRPTWIDGRSDERDQPFCSAPDQGSAVQSRVSWRCCAASTPRASPNSTVICCTRCRRTAMPPRRLAGRAASRRWRRGRRGLEGRHGAVDRRFDRVDRGSTPRQEDAGLDTYGGAVAELLRFSDKRGEAPAMEAAEWPKRFVNRAAVRARERPPSSPTSPGIRAGQAPRVRYQVRGGIPYAIAKSLAAALADPCGWRPRPPTSPTPAVRRRDPESPGPDAGLQPVALVSTGTPPA